MEVRVVDVGEYLCIYAPELEGRVVKDGLKALVNSKTVYKGRMLKPL